MYNPQWRRENVIAFGISQPHVALSASEDTA